MKGKNERLSPTLFLVSLIDFPLESILEFREDAVYRLRPKERAREGKKALFKREEIVGKKVVLDIFLEGVTSCYFVDGTWNWNPGSRRVVQDLDFLN